MKLMLVFFVLFISSAAPAQVAHLVISQVYGGGGNTGAPFTHDYIELFNPSSSPISLDGMSVQYSGAGSATWSSNTVPLSGSVGAGQYFLIQLTSGGANGSALPQPDLLSTAISLSSGSGKIALVNNSTPLSGNCTQTGIIDFLGYGSADCHESAAAPAASNSTSLLRNLNGCSDQDNNATDFILSIPDPRNSRAHRHECSGSLIMQQVFTSPFCIDDARSAEGTVQFSAKGLFDNTATEVVLSNAAGSFIAPTIIGNTVLHGIDPGGTAGIRIPEGLVTGTSYRIRVQSSHPSLTGTPFGIEIINKTKNAAALAAVPGSGQLLLHWNNPSGCFDEIMIVVKEGSAINGTPSGDGSAYRANLDFTGSGSAFDGGKVVYKGSAPGQVVTGLVDGTLYHIVAFSRKGAYWSTGISTEAVPRIVPQAGEVVINQVSPDYNGAQDEYIELVNRTSKTFDLSDLSLRFANTDGRNVVAGGTLSGKLPPHGYWLLSPNDTITVGKTQGVVPDQIIDGGFAAQNQQLALIRKTDNLIIDAVAYGTINLPLYVEGNPSVNPPANGGLKRAVDGKDSNHNNQDFIRVNQGDIELLNSRSRLANDGAFIDAGKYRYLKVVGDGVLAGNISAEKLLLEQGVLVIGNYQLRADSLAGGSASTYVRTNGEGSLIVKITDSLLIPVGNSTYNPVTIGNKESRYWSVRVADELHSSVPFTTATAVQRTWQVQPSGTVTQSTALQFEYDNRQQVGSAFSSTATVEVWNLENTWTITGPPQYPLLTPRGTVMVLVQDPKQFSYFSIANVQAPLAIRFSDFTALPGTDHIRLSFSNESESEVMQYVVERSFNGNDFHPLAVLKPTANNHGRATYQVVDWHPYAGYNFYRVKGTETSGRKFYTYIAKAGTIKTTRILSVVPNPVRGKMLYWEATIPKGVFEVVIRNSAGATISTTTFRHSGGTAYHQLALPPGLAPGVYILQLQNSEKQLQKLFLLE